MKPRCISLLLALLLIIGISPLTYAAEYPAKATAKPSPQELKVNGETVDCGKYSINMENYFKLRDLAYILNGTSAQFEIGYESGMISVTTGAPYTQTDGTEMKGNAAGEKEATLSDDKVMLNGVETPLTAYKIGSSNYFRLRDVGSAFHFDVDYDAASDTVLINTYSDTILEDIARGFSVSIVNSSKVADNPAPKAAPVDFTDPEMPTNVIYSVLDTLRWVHEGDYFYCYFSVPKMPEGFAANVDARVGYETGLALGHISQSPNYLEQDAMGDRQGTGYFDKNTTFFTEGSYCIVFDGKVSLGDITSLPSDRVGALGFYVETEKIYNTESNVEYVFSELSFEDLSIFPSTGHYRSYFTTNTVEDILSLWK